MLLKIRKRFFEERRANNFDSPMADSFSKKSLEVTYNRIFFVLVIFSLTFIVLSARLFNVTVFGTEVTGVRSSINIADLQFERGDIVDRNGVLVASNLSTASLFANTKNIPEPKEAAKELTKILPTLAYNDVLKKLESGKGFVWIKRNLTPKEQYEINNLGIPGLNFKREEKRVYPHGRLLSHILGNVGVDGHGLSGAEKQFDNLLLSEQSKDEPLKLSIDVRVQTALYESLSAGVKEFKAIGGNGIVMDVNTGEVVAMASLPDYNPNIIRGADVKNKFNRNTLGVYEMGSIFKALTTAMALDKNVVNMTTTYDITNPIRVGRFEISDFHPRKGPHTIPEIFMHSSNIGTAKMALDVGAKEQQNFLRKLGLLEETKIDLPEKARPMYPKNWKKVNTMTISYGHGIAVTPIQMAAATAAMINGGILYEPRILKAEDENDVIENSKKVIKQSTSDNMRKLLRLVVEHGTGGKAEVKGYFVGGKTGSAEKLNPEGGYSKNANLSSFIAAFPAYDPKYLLLVVLDEPVGNASTGGYATGGQTAAPIVGKVVERIAPTLGIKPAAENSSVVLKKLDLDYALREKKLANN